ncbi:adenosylcobinamide-phosphate synthase [Fervidobacterium changbaicum]|uniref:adenosylcobinamide-phosphate synthase CbiB n=1 Tax=Fervidobacterium changbaicum TaxID=310769 RepID=UPI00088C511B|nr:adenosylcobinamide-phosphate synthase CbiB [Fervidobacterium changbaicum]SDH08751.1 adenosylcobinamide-phosphate synthase [Fervidobacterium changbaicum]
MSPSSDKVYVFLFAVTIDLLFGEYPSKLHPVVYMGFVGKLFDKVTQQKKNALRFIAGAFALVVEIFFFGAIAVVVLHFRKVESSTFGIVLFAIKVYLLKSTFSIKSLYQHMSRCYTDDLETLRKNVSYIVSRDVSKLTKGHLYSAAIESLSENISDSITGPLFFYILFDLPGALIYRIVNTYDALFGYRNERYEWFGKFHARSDDLLNLVPSRLTALVISFFNPLRAWRNMIKYGAIKINAMYPMSAFAGVLGFGIEKVGYYKVEGRLPEKEDVKRALKLYAKVVVLILATAVVVLVWQTIQKG